MNAGQTVARLLQIIFVSKAAHPEFFPDAHRERRESLLDIIEPQLRYRAKQLNFTYLRPELTRDGEMLLSALPSRFIEKYGRELSFTHRAGMSLVIL